MRGNLCFVKNFPRKGFAIAFVRRPLDLNGTINNQMHFNHFTMRVTSHFTSKAYTSQMKVAQFTQFVLLYVACTPYMVHIYVMQAKLFILGKVQKKLSFPL